MDQRYVRLSEAKVRDVVGYNEWASKKDQPIMRFIIVVIDEIHTPDSSRFWEAATYPERFEQGIEPDSYDKEFARLWYTQQGYRGEGTPPVMPEEMIRQVLERYIIAYERLTGQSFEVPESNPQERILMNLGPYVRRS